MLETPGVFCFCWRSQFLGETWQHWHWWFETLAEIPIALNYLEVCKSLQTTDLSRKYRTSRRTENGFQPPNPSMILVFSWFAGWGLLAIPKRLGPMQSCWMQSWLRPMHYCRPVGVFSYGIWTWSVNWSHPNNETSKWKENHKHESFCVISSICVIYTYFIFSTSTAYTSSRFKLSNIFESHLMKDQIALRTDLPIAK